VPPELIIYNANIITQNRAQQISFPLNNTNQYVNYVVHLTLIAPVSRNPFRLSVTFLDAEPSCNGCDVLKIFSIAEDPNRQRALISQIGTKYVQILKFTILFIYPEVNLLFPILFIVILKQHLVAHLLAQLQRRYFSSLLTVVIQG